LKNFFWELFDYSIPVFVFASAVTLTIMVVYIKEFRGAKGSYIQIALEQYRSGGLKGKIFAISSSLIVLCFGYYITLSLAKYAP
jgi:hypothetical protein